MVVSAINRAWPQSTDVTPQALDLDTRGELGGSDTNLHRTTQRVNEYVHVATCERTTQIARENTPCLTLRSSLTMASMRLHSFTRWLAMFVILVVPFAIAATAQTVMNESAWKAKRE